MNKLILFLGVVLLSGCSIFEAPIPDENTGVYSYEQIQEVLLTTRQEYEQETGNALYREYPTWSINSKDVYADKRNRLANRMAFNTDKNICHHFALRFIDKMGAGQYVIVTSPMGDRPNDHAMVYVEGYFVDNNSVYPYHPNQLTGYKFKDPELQAMIDKYEDNF